MLRLNLSLKFILSTTLMVILIISLLIIDVHYREQAIIEGKMQRKASILAEVLSMASANAFLIYDYSTLRRFSTIVGKDEDVVSVAFVDNSGRIKMHNDIDMIGKLIESTAPAAAFEKNQAATIVDPLNRTELIYPFSEPIVVGDRQLGLVHINMSTQSLVQDLAASRKRLLMIGLTAIVAAGLGAVFMARMISGPLRRLAEGAKQISNGNLNWSVRINTGDEIEVLAKAFEYMTRSLRGYIDSVVVKEKMVALGELAAGIAHEVRNPLEPIKGSAELLQKKYGGDPNIVKYTQIIKEEINGVCKFLDQFLQLAKPPEPKEEPVDMHQLIDETIAFTGFHLSEHRMDIVKDFQAPVASVIADPQQMKQVFLNLILNAVQAKTSSDGEGVIKISTALEKDASYLNGKNEKIDQTFLAMTFFDNGAGIEPAKIGKIFDPFFTTKSDGTGLGLAICQAIVERHGGHIEAQSQAGLWTRIKLRIPLGKTDSTAITAFFPLKA